MADYYPLIARAIAGLDPAASGETRRALYERARTALIGQLRNVQPALSEAEITRERLALEDAVRRVEAEAAKRARPDAARPRADAPPSQHPRREAPRPGDALRDSVRATRPAPPPLSSNRERPAAGLDNPPLAPEPRPARNLRGDPPPQAPRGPAAPPRDLRAPDQRRTDTQMLDAWTQEARSGTPRRSLDEGRPAGPGVRGMRDVVADAEALGRGGAQGGRTARRPAATSQLDRTTTRDLDSRGDSETYSYDESLEEAERYQPQPQSQPDRARVRIGPRDEEEVVVKRGFPVKTAIGIVAAIVLIGLAVLFYRQVYPSIRAMLKPSGPVIDTQKDTAGTRPKITDRVGQPGQQIAPVAQRVVLYDEDPSAPQGKQYVGSVIWRTEAVKVPAGQPADIGVRADIEIPERKIKMTMTVRRNADASLPASHTAELTFVLPADLGATVANVPGVLMKSNEQARGTPLAGLAVKVTDGFFLVGLSATEADKARNLQLLKERSWFDIPIVYSNQRRAIIAVEKGAPGERAFNEAFTAWGQ